MPKNYRYIEVMPSKDPILGGPEVHVIRFHAGTNTKDITLSSRELKELKQKLGVYLNTYNI